MGIDRAKRFLREADICLVVFDGASGLATDDEEILKEIGDKPRVTVANKADIAINADLPSDLTVSAETGENIEKIKERLYEKAFESGVDSDVDYLTEERHLYALQSAKKSLEDAVAGFEANTADLSTIDIKNAWDALGEISGETASEKIIDEIFSKFCVGK